MPNLRLDEETYRQLLIIAGRMQAEQGKAVSVADAVREALRALEEKESK